MIGCIVAVLSEKAFSVEAFTLSLVKMNGVLIRGGGGHCGVDGASLRMPKAKTVKGRLPKRRRSSLVLEMINSESNENDDVEDDVDDWNMVGDGPNLDVFLHDLTWRVEKLRLEEQNKRRFLRAGARFLPYDECRKWVQAWGKSYWQTQADWEKWISQGEKRNAYIPSRPDEYYTKSGDWISWEHFLITPPESSSSSSSSTACNTTDTEYDDEELRRQKPK
jgi:hypothetical protein